MRPQLDSGSAARLVVVPMLCALGLAAAAAVPARAASPSTGSGYDETGQAALLGVSGAGANGVGGSGAGAAGANGAAPNRLRIAPSGGARVVAGAAPAAAGGLDPCPAGTSASVGVPDDDQLVVRGRTAYVTDRLTGEVDPVGIVVIRRGRLVALAPHAETSAAGRAAARCQPSCPTAADDVPIKAASGRWVVVDRATHVIEPDDRVALLDAQRVVLEPVDTTPGPTGWPCCVTATTAAAARGPVGAAGGQGSGGAAALAKIVGGVLAAFALLGLGALMRTVWERREHPEARPGW